MGRIAHVLRHTATPTAVVDDAPDAPADWQEGEPGEGPGPVPGTPFKCILFLPTGNEEANAFRPRNITRPTLLFEPRDTAGAS